MPATKKSGRKQEATESPKTWSDALLLLLGSINRRGNNPKLAEVAEQELLALAAKLDEVNAESRKRRAVEAEKTGMVSIEPIWVDIMAGLIRSLSGEYSTAKSKRLAEQELMALGARIDNLNAKKVVVPVPSPDKLIPHQRSL